MVGGSSMKRVLALDLLCPEGHVAFDSGVIGALGQCAIVHLAVAKGYFGRESPTGASVTYEAPQWLYVPARTRLCSKARVKQLLVALYWTFRLRLSSYDAILVLSYETISFSVAIALFGRQTALFAFDHNNLDDLMSRLKQWCFRRLSRRVHHLVPEPYMMDVVRRFGGPRVRGSVVPFPIRHFSATGTEEVMDGNGKARLRCVGPSGSNDEAFVEWMIHREASTSVLRRHGVSLYLHSRNESFDDGWLYVYRERLDDDVYESRLRDADLVVLPYPQTFENRVSGVLLEALAYRRHWIGTDTPMFRDYALMYPTLGQVCQTYEELLLALLRVTRAELRMTPDSAWDAVATAHSRGAVAEALVRALESSR